MIDDPIHLKQLRLSVVKELAFKNPLLEPLLINLLQKGLLELEVTLESSTAYTDISERTNGNTYFIKLGLGRMDDSTRNKILFGSEFFREDELITYRLLHEVCHVFIAEGQFHNDPRVLSLMRIIKDQQSRTNKFFTGLSNFKNNGRLIKFLAKLTNYELREEPLDEEDCVELLAMALWDPEYFQSYLNFMMNPNFQGIRSRMNMLTLTPESAEAIGGLVQSIVLQLPKFVAV